MKTFRRNIFFFISLITIVTCILIYFKLNAFLSFGKEDHFMDGYFVDTPGCHMIALNPFSHQAMSHFHRAQPMNCTKVQLMDARTIDGHNYLILLMTEKDIIQMANVRMISDIRCHYQAIRRINDHKNNRLPGKEFRLMKNPIEINIGKGFAIARVQCFGYMNESIYNDVHFFVPQRKPLKDLGHNRLSVMILGIDSISHMQFIRSMPLLAAYIETLPHVEFWGFNRVGRNSYPNLVPLFSGLNETELEEDCYTGERDYDKCNFIWQHFRGAGYTTIYGEDTYVGGTFNYGKWGFNRQPTDFYLRPVMLEVDEHTRYSIDKDESIHCSGGRKYAEILYEFIHKLMPHLEQGLHFSYFWQSQGVHDYFNYAQLVENDYLKLIYRMQANQILNHTLVVFMADHGLRFGGFRNTKQGMLEESQPLLIALYPYWLKRTFPKALANLHQNGHSLVTAFDLHETLKDLSNLHDLRDSQIVKRTKLLEELGGRMPRGISLFLPIPKERDCDAAGVPASYCLCQTFTEMDVSNEKAQRAARFVVNSINRLLKDFKECQPLVLEDIKEAYQLQGNGLQNEVEIKVRVETSPGRGCFEGTARFLDESLMLSGPVLRTNKYGNQSDCVDNYQIEMYCYCS